MEREERKRGRERGEKERWRKRRRERERRKREGERRRGERDRERWKETYGYILFALLFCNKRLKESGGEWIIHCSLIIHL